jgi:predicted O-methyltransferase YrrM
VTGPFVGGAVARQVPDVTGLDPAPARRLLRPLDDRAIRVLRGHHEPQEELVFHRVLERLAADGGEPSMIEFGSFWTYYGLWFCHALPAGTVVAVEPDPA